MDAAAPGPTDAAAPVCGFLQPASGGDLDGCGRPRQRWRQQIEQLNAGSDLATLTAMSTPVRALTRLSLLMPSDFLL